MKQNVTVNRKLLWKEVGKVNGKRGQNCKGIKDRTYRLAVGQDNVRKN